MYEALRIAVEALSDSIAVEEAAADTLFTAGIKIAAQGATMEAEAFRSLSRTHRIRALGLRGQIAILRDTAARHYQSECSTA